MIMITITIVITMTIAIMIMIMIMIMIVIMITTTTTTITTTVISKETILTETQQFKQLGERSLKKIQGFNRIRTRDLREYWCDALPSERWSHTLGARSFLLVQSFQWRNRPYAKMAAVNFCHREELFVNRNILLHCKDQVKRNHCMKF